MRVLLLLALIYPAMASAGFETGNTLLSTCAEERTFFQDGVCSGYIVGIMDEHETLLAWEELNEPAYCAPDGVTIGQAKAIVIKYLKEHPEDLHVSASGLVLNALAVAFKPRVKFENGEPVVYCP